MKTDMTRVDAAIAAYRKHPAISTMASAMLAMSGGALGAAIALRVIIAFGLL